MTFEMIYHFTNDKATNEKFEFFDSTFSKTIV